MSSYVEQELSRWQREIREAQERMRNLHAATGDVLMFDERPDLAIGDLVEARGRRMVVVRVTEPSDVLGLKIGEGVCYSNRRSHKYAVQLVAARDDR